MNSTLKEMYKQLLKEDELEKLHNRVKSRTHMAEKCLRMWVDIEDNKTSKYDEVSERFNQNSCMIKKDRKKKLNNIVITIG